VSAAQPGGEGGAPGGARRAPDARLEQALGHGFGEPALLVRALTHASAAHERDGSRGNERLEFLGDAVLDLVLSRALFEAHPDWTEGRLSRTRAALVNAEALAARARELGLGDYVRLGRTEVQSGGHEKGRILANVLEAVVAALYLDAGLEPVWRLARRLFPEAFDPAAAAPARDPKTRLNEWAHATAGAPPRYQRLDDRGEERGAERFEVEVRVAGEVLGRGVGSTWRAAEREAARAALARAEAGPRDPDAGSQDPGGG
jgi:ribonuclease-3